MKKFLFIVITLLAFNASNTTINAEVKATREGKVFIQNAHHSSTGVVKQTPYTWKDSKGVEYPIMMSANGSCFVNKISSKTGKEYKYYLGPEISQEICKEMGVEYKGKKVTPKNS